MQCILTHTRLHTENDLLTAAPSIGRITGSNSIETLVRVGLEKENGIPSDSKMIVLHDFTPCVDDELEVKRGQIVSVLYQENDWVYVIRESDHHHYHRGLSSSQSMNSVDSSSEGFIPFSYCTPVSSLLADMVIKHKKVPRPNDLMNLPSLLHNPHAHPSASSSSSTTAALIDGGVVSNSNNENNANASNKSSTSSQQQHNNNLNHYHTFNQPMHLLKGKVTTNASSLAGSLAGQTSGPILTANPHHHHHHALHQQQSIMMMHHHLTCNSDSDPGKDLDSYSGAASDVHPFFKDPCGHRFIVLYNFIARDENDINVERGEFVTVLNMDDPDWYWILRSDGLEGFVPSSFLCSLDPDAIAGNF